MALLARAAAIEVRRSEGPSMRMQDLASLSIGAMALLDVNVTVRAAAGLALTLSHVRSALTAIAGGIAFIAGGLKAPPGMFDAGLRTRPTVSADWAVFSALSRLLWDPYLPTSGADSFTSVSIRDEGQPVGRLGISAYRWMRLAEVPAGPERALAANWILDRGAEEVGRAMRDSFHWQSLQAGLGPIEPELLFAGLILLATSSQQGPVDAGIWRLSHPIVTATLSVAAGIMSQFDLADALGGPAGEISGPSRRRWDHWLASNSEGPLRW